MRKNVREKAREKLDCKRKTVTASSILERMNKVSVDRKDGAVQRMLTLFRKRELKKSRE